MPKIGNNSSQRLNAKQIEIIEEIVIKLAIVLDNLITFYQKPDQIMEAYSYLTSSQTNLTRIFATLILKNIDTEKGAYQAQIKEQIIEISTELQKEPLTEFLTNSSNLSKVLKRFEDDGIIFSIVGKKEIKKKSPKSISRKPKADIYRKGERPEGPALVKMSKGLPVVKKLTPTVEDYRTILSNPYALMIINDRLRKHARLEEAYNIVVKYAFSFFKMADEKSYDFLQIFRVFPIDINTDRMPDPKIFQESLSYTDDQEIEQLGKQFVQYLLNNPNAGIFFIFSLAKLANKG